MITPMDGSKQKLDNSCSTLGCVQTYINYIWGLYSIIRDFQSEKKNAHMNK